MIIVKVTGRKLPTALIGEDGEPEYIVDESPMTIMASTLKAAQDASVPLMKEHAHAPDATVEVVDGAKSTKLTLAEWLTACGLHKPE